MPVSTKDIEKFARKVDGLQRRAITLKPQVTQQLREASKVAHDAIVNAILANANLDAHVVGEVGRVIEREMNALAGKTAQIIRAGQEAAYAQAVTIASDIAIGFGIETAFFQPTAELLTIATNFTADLVRTIPAEMMPKVNAALSRGAIGGMNPHQVMRKIDEIIGASGKQVSYIAERIARTEIQRIYSATLDQQMQKLSGSLMGDLSKKVMKEWVSGGGGPNRRPEHQEMDGQRVALDDPFITPWTGESLMYPRDAGGSAEQVINCQCGWKVVTDNLEEIARENVGLIAHELF